MKKTLFASLSLFLVLFAGLAFGQTTMTTTTLSAAVSTTSTTTIRVASATGMTAGATMLFIEDGTGGTGAGEALFVNSVNGTAIGVTRGYYGTYSNLHISGAVVFVGPPSAFQVVEPSGGCTAANQPFTPYLNIKTGNVWLCSTVLLRWVPGVGNVSAPVGPTASVVTAATITPSGPLFHTTGTTAVVTINLPTGASDGQITIVFDGSGAGLTWTAAGNISVAGTATTAASAVTFVFDRNLAKWVPSRLA